MIFVKVPVGRSVSITDLQRYPRRGCQDYEIGREEPMVQGQGYGNRTNLRRITVTAGAGNPAAEIAIATCTDLPEQTGLRNQHYANQAGYQLIQLASGSGGKSTRGQDGEYRQLEHRP